jgi:hypothetical protein
MGNYTHGTVYRDYKRRHKFCTKLFFFFAVLTILIRYKDEGGKNNSILQEYLEKCLQSENVLLEIVYRDIKQNQDTNPLFQYMSSLRLVV